MFEVTDRAKELIARALDENEAGEGDALRIYLTDDGEFEMGVDEVRDDDIIVPESGRPLVIVDPEMTWELEGAVLDAEEGPEGYDLMLDLPDHDGEDDEDGEVEASANGVS